MQAPTRVQPEHRSDGPWLRLLWLAVVLAAADAFVPFAPFMPGRALDPSWMYALNQAVGQGLSFGRDIVFTFGPYASIFTKTYDPATVLRMLAGSIYLALVFVGCLRALADGAPARVGVLAGMLLLLLVIGIDSLLMSLPLLIGTVVFRSARVGAARAEPAVCGRDALFVGAFASFGLLPLVKGTLMLLCVFVAGLCLLFLLRRRLWRRALLCAVTPLIAMVVLWVGAGESIQGLPAYFASMAPIVAGYSEAMAVHGPLRELLLFLVPAALVLAVAATQVTRQADERLFMLALLGGFLFLSFKAGFVRHDIHVYIALSNLLATVLVLLLVVERQQFGNRGLLIAFLVTSALSCAYLVDRTIRKQVRAPGGTSNPMVPRVFALDARPWKLQFDEARQHVADDCALGFALRGSVDVYSYEQACLLAAGMAWKPRPVLQGYSAYTPALARLDEAHLRGADAPDHVVYRLQTIDDRFPTLDDGLSLPALLDNYALAAAHGDWLVLDRKPQLAPASRYETLAHLDAKLGQDVAVPAGEPLFAEIVVRPTLMGRFLALAYKPPVLTLRATLGQGSTVSYRVNAGMMVSGFFLSPSIEATADVQALFERRPGAPGGRAVTSLRIDSSSRLPLWQADYVVTLKRYQYGAAVRRAPP